VRANNPAMKYEVGFGRPPKHSRFRKGVSGNPGGRPKGSRNLVSILQDILQETTVVQENRKRVRVSKGEAMLRNLVQRAVSGDITAIKHVAELVPPQEFEAIDPQKALEPIKTDDGLLIPKAFLHRRFVRECSSVFGLKERDGGQVSYIVVTEKQCAKMAAEMKRIFGWQPTSHEAVKMANTSLLVKEVDEQAESGEPAEVEY
jgi:hypothetical protein